MYMSTVPPVVVGMGIRGAYDFVYGVTGIGSYYVLATSRTTGSLSADFQVGTC